MKPTKKNVLVLILASLMLFACDRQEPEQKAKPKPKPEQPKPLSMLNLVPEDTFFFSGGLEPFPLQDVLRANAGSFNMLKGLDPKEMLPVWKDTDKPGQRMAVELWTDYYTTIMTPESQLETWGFEEKPSAVSYAIGLAPVLLRISLKDVDRFNKKIDEIETKAGVTKKVEALDKASYRRYVLNEKDPSVHMIIGVDGKHAVFMLDIGIDSEATLAMALGQKKPEKSLARTGRIEALKEKYNLHPSLIGYIDHRQLITGLTSKDGNRIARMIQVLAPQLQEGKQNEAKQEQKQDGPQQEQNAPKQEQEGINYLAELQEEGCRNDLTAIGGNWPRTVFGYTAMDLQSKPSRIESILVVESNDTVLMEGLRSLRGFIPEYVRTAAEPPVFSAGIGLHPENIGPFIMKQWTEITKKEYSCSFLQDMQESLKAQNPAAAGMASGMAAGVRGIALSLLSLTLDQAEEGGAPMPKEIDAIISLAAQDPAVFLQTVSALFPPLAELQIPADGTPVQLPLPMPLPFPVMAAIQGKHLTVYAGTKAEGIAKGLSSTSLESSQGFMVADIDYGKYYGLLGDTLSTLKVKGEEKAEAVAILEAMKNAKMRVRMDLDFTDRGIEMKGDVITTE